jgi:TRAP-type C4-dicarboxylate transport system substrate-binding protein
VSSIHKQQLTIKEGHLKKVILFLLATIVIISIIFAGCAAPAPAPKTTPAPTPTPAPAPVEFKYNIQAPGAAQPSVYEPAERFVKNVAAKTNGRVKITMFYNFGLAPGPETYSATVKGICDLGESNTGYSPGQFPWTDATILPTGYPSSVVQSKVMNDFYDKYKPKEWDEVVPLEFKTPPPFWIGTINKAVRGFDDIKGLQVRVTSKPAADLFTLMGAAPRIVPIGEAYELLSKGVLDGVIAGPEAFPGFKFDEVCKYFTDITAVAMGNCSYLVANKQTWAKLSADDQKLMFQLSREYGIDRATTWDQINDAVPIKWKTMAGKEAIKMPPAEVAKFKEKANIVIEDWIKASTAKGLPAAELVKFVSDRVDFYSKQK